MIKNRSAAYLLQKRRPRGREEEGDEEGGSGGEWGNGKGGNGEEEEGVVVNPMYLISFAVSESSRG